MEKIVIACILLGWFSSEEIVRTAEDIRCRRFDRWRIFRLAACLLRTYQLFCVLHRAYSFSVMVAFLLRSDSLLLMLFTTRVAVFTVLPSLSKKIIAGKRAEEGQKKWMKDSQQRGDIKIFRTISYLVRRVTAEKVVVWRVFCSLFNLISPTKVGKVGDLKQRQT